MCCKDFQVLLDVYYIYCRTSKIIKLLRGSRFVASAAVHWVQILYILSELFAGCCMPVRLC